MTEASGVHIEDLRVDNPGCAVPGRSVEGSPEVEEEHGGYSRTGEMLRGIVLWVYHCDIRTYVPVYESE